MKAAHLALLSAAATLTYGQATAGPQMQLTAWNSSSKLSPEQIKLGQLSPGLTSSLEIILNFDRTQLANGGPSQDSFYDLKKDSQNLPPRSAGQVLKLQQFTDPTPYNIPAETALSRVIYSSTNINGTLVPASAYVLWPYTPKSSSKLYSESTLCQKAPVVVWAHGTSGFYADGSPSAHRSLFYGDIMPFTLAQAGYVVIAPDYAGLGVETSWDDTFIPHQYGASEANAADALNALRAVRKSFSDRITDEYVIVGHSQGGAVSWAMSELLENDRELYQDVEKDYLGTVIFGPGLNPVPAAPQFFLPLIGKYLNGVFPSFTLSDWLSPLGVSRVDLLNQVQGGQFFGQALFSNATEVLNPSWSDSWYLDAITNLTTPGNRPYREPMLLIQGVADSATNFNITLAAFNSTCSKYPGDFQFMALPGVGHFPAIEASRSVWLQWIEDRFDKKPVTAKGCVNSELKSFLPLAQYQPFTKSFFQWSGSPNWTYEVPAGSF